jgi:anthranilate phosphoribosyltransferase
MIKESIQKLVERLNLTYEEAGEAMKEIMSGKATNAQIAALLTSLRIKGETVEEITAFSEIMRENCCIIRPHVNGRLVDTCGTGGDKIKTFNVSTASAFVIAGTGVAIAKHGNRSVTSRSGSADVLEQFGFNLKMTPEAVEKSIEQIGIGFMFAPAFHPAMKYAVEPRRELGIRTVFNVLGPLANPACANAQVVGVYAPKLTNTLACVLKRLGCEEAMVVHGLDGLDEISTIGKTAIAWLKDGKVENFTVDPIDFGVKQANAADIQGKTPEDNAEIIFKILNGFVRPNDAKMEMVLVNSAAGIIVGGKAENFKSGMELARESITSGAAGMKLRLLVEASGGSLSKIEELESKYA